MRIVRCPLAFPPLLYYQLWHDLTHASAAGRWLRGQVREVARELARGAPPAFAHGPSTDMARDLQADISRP